MSVQQQMWNIVAGTSKSIYVSNPKNGGGLHNYGLAVDITLCWRNDVRNAQGKLLHTAGDTTGLSMGTPIDYLGNGCAQPWQPEASKSCPQNGGISISKLAHKPKLTTKWCDRITP